MSFDAAKALNFRIAKQKEAEALYFELLPKLEAQIAGLKVKELKAYADSATVSRKRYSDSPTKANIIGAIKERLTSMCYERVGYPVPFKQQYGVLTQF